MDTSKVAAVMSGFSLEPLKEPIGFIRLIQFILAIFAFSTCAGSGFKFLLILHCGSEDPQPISATYSYPFILRDELFTWNRCETPPGVKQENRIPGNFASQAEYFVAVGVLCFLYTLATLVVYILFDKLYRSNDKIPVADFLITAVLAVMWLISSSAWADAIVNMSSFSDEEYIKNNLVSDCGKTDVTCTFKETANFAAENISVIFGFLNLLVWCGNLWFLYKETYWFKVRARPPQDQTTTPETV